MKKIFTIILVAVILLSVTSCNGSESVSNTERTTTATTITTTTSSETTTTEMNVTISEATDTETSTDVVEIANEEPPYDLDINNIGKTFNEMLEKYPELIIEGKSWGWVYEHCLKIPNSEFYYYFYGYEIYSPQLEDVRINFGDELKVAGVIAPVGDIFPYTTDVMLADEFFATIGVLEYEHDYESDVSWFARSYIYFNYNDMFCVINALEKDEFGRYKELENIKHSFLVFYKNEEIVKSNNKVLYKYAQTLE